MPRLAPTASAALSLTLFSLWMAGLFSGLLLGGAVHLLLLGAGALFPWRTLRS
ncbi:MAG TPA: hypothetical protein VMM92_00285 [Thermoanaerobaculia bacterium]|nr:hypothetical protein [Thermoanaerobaculia bacterium]